ncbi:MAG: AccI family restriction endonuclease, partial [Chloroflexi bacterium]|nr:AccI family restriction endonuclease [Chloroflexota bacterium]
MHLFEKLLSACKENIEFELKWCIPIEWSDFLINPRRLRGSDFLMRWSQGVWSEERIIQAVNDTQEFFAIPYGPSGTAPSDDVRAFELYFERLEAAGLSTMKRPDLLIFKIQDKENIMVWLNTIGGIRELPFIPEDNSSLRILLEKAILAVECENSFWKGRRMPD